MKRKELISLRESLRMTQEDTAKLAGIDRRTYNKIETGSIKKPSWNIVGRISWALYADPFELFPIKRMKDRSADGSIHGKKVAA